MSTNRKTTVGVIFGGRSVEHDVSVVTGHQVMRAFNRERFDIVPIYINRQGNWFTGEPLLEIDNFKQDMTSIKGVEPCLLSPNVRHHGLIINPLAGRFARSSIIRLDVVFPALHGTHGEDGTIQGLCELADIPYVGCATLASALTNDKLMTKQVLRQSGVPVLDEVAVMRDEWLGEPNKVVERIKTVLDYPVFVKPATLGSSIGVGRADSDELLRASLDVAANFDRRILVERAAIGCVEINCSVMGYGQNIEASVLEQPVSWEEFLTYEEKYLRGGEGMKSAERIIPAPISEALTQKIQQIAIDAFQAVDGRGIARIDFLVEPDSETVYLNEINTLPGSLAFYLWQENGMGAGEVVEKLVQLARDAYADKRRNTYDYQTDLIAMTAARGLKGTKGAKSTPQQN